MTIFGLVFRPIYCISIESSRQLSDDRIKRETLSNNLSLVPKFIVIINIYIYIFMHTYMYVCLYIMSFFASIGEMPEND